MKIDEEINRFERLASDYEFNLEMHQHNVMKLSVNDIERMKRNAQENRQLAEWLKELKQLKHVLYYELNGVKEKIKAKEKYDVNLSVYKGCLEDFMQFVFDIKTQEMCSKCKYYDYWGTYSISCDGKITGDKHCDLEFIDVFLGDKCHFERKEGCEGVSADDD